MPDETQQGLGTFGALVNGELVINPGPTWSFKGGQNPPEVYGFYNPSTNQFRLRARTELGDWFDFFVSNPRLGQNTIDSVFFRHYAARNAPQIRFTRFDGIASGTFEFDAKLYDRNTNEPISDKKIQVRRGRFDVEVWQ